MKIKFKKLNPNAITPTKAHPTDAGFDLYALTMTKNIDYLYIEYGTGIAIEIPVGHVGLIFPRSSISNVPQWLSNSVGVIDSGYRGEIKFRFKSALYGIGGGDRYQPGDKIGQLIIMPIPHIELIETDHLSESDRGAGGFGSTGK